MRVMSYSIFVDTFGKALLRVDGCLSGKSYGRKMSRLPLFSRIDDQAFSASEQLYALRSHLVFLEKTRIRFYGKQERLNTTNIGISLHVEFTRERITLPAFLESQ